MNLVSNKYYHPDKDWYVKHKVAPPEAISHGVEDTLKNPLSEQIPKNRVSKWHLSGNKLIAQTELGEVVNIIPPEYVMRGVDKNNLPILEKIVL
jgi:hypothetical protein